MTVPKRSHENVTADGTCQGLNSLSRWSSNAESVSLSDTVESSEDKPTSKHSARYVYIGRSFTA